MPFSTFAKFCYYDLCLFQYYWNSLINHKGNPVPNNHSFLFPPPSRPSPWQALIYILSLWTSLLWTFHINRIIHYVIICIWLLSLSIKFSRFTHVAACISIFYGWVIFHLWLYYVLFIHSSVDDYLKHFQNLAVVNNAVIEHSHTSFCLNADFPFFWVSTSE